MPATGLESPVLLLELNEILCYAAREISLQLQNCVQARMSLSTDYGPPIRAFFKHIQKFWHKKLGLPKVVRYLGVFLVVLKVRQSRNVFFKPTILPKTERTNSFFGLTEL